MRSKMKPLFFLCVGALCLCAALLAIARAAHQTGDHQLERAARKLLRDRYGIEVSFRHATEPERTVADGSR